MVNRNTFAFFVVLLALLGPLVPSHWIKPSEPVGRTEACVLREDAAGGTATIGAATLASVPHYLAEMRGQQWNKDVITVRLETSDPRRKAGETGKILAEATRLWNEEIGGVVRIVWTTDAEADVTVRFAPQRDLPFRAVGKTEAQFRMTSRTLVHADVTLNEGMSDARLLQVAAHEIGHALGIPGHSPHTDDLMYPVTHTPARITERDRNTMCLNYGSTPARYPVPPATVATLGGTQ